MEIQRNVDFASVARQIVSDLVGAHPEALEEISDRGLINRVFVAKVSSQELVVRLNVAANAELNYFKESWCIDKASDQGILVPHVVDIGKRNRVAYMIQDFIPGVPGSLDTQNNLQLWSRIGRYAALANAIPVNGYGSTMSLAEPGVFLGTWESHVKESLQIVFRDDYWARLLVFSDKEIAQLQDSLPACAGLKSQSGLCHVDIGPLNCILRDGDIDQLYLLDWEFAEAAPVPHYQLACVAKYWGLNSQIMSSFVDGYGMAGEEFEAIRGDVSLLTVLGALECVRWAQDNHPERVEEYSESAQFIAREVLLN